MIMILKLMIIIPLSICMISDMITIQKSKNSQLRMAHLRAILLSLSLIYLIVYL